MGVYVVAQEGEGGLLWHKICWAICQQDISPPLSRNEMSLTLKQLSTLGLLLAISLSMRVCMCMCEWCVCVGKSWKTRTRKKKCNKPKANKNSIYVPSSSTFVAWLFLDFVLLMKKVCASLPFLCFELFDERENIFRFFFLRFRPDNAFVVPASSTFH